MLFMTVPTAGSHPEILGAMIRDCGLPREHVVIIATAPGVEVPDGCVVIEDFGPRNIQRWWRTGIEESKARGATVVAVVNDDIRLTPQTLPQLNEALQVTGATIASPSRPQRRDRVHRRPLVPYSPRIWGCLWLIDASSSLRPDPRYVWWYGDCDLDIRARRDYRGVVTREVEYEHFFPGEGTGLSAELTAQSDRDAVTFQHDYARLLTLSRLATAPRRLFERHFARSSQA